MQASLQSSVYLASLQEVPLKKGPIAYNPQGENKKHPEIKTSQ